MGVKHIWLVFEDSTYQRTGGYWDGMRKKKIHPQWNLPTPVSSVVGIATMMGWFGNAKPYRLGWVRHPIHVYVKHDVDTNVVTVHAPHPVGDELTDITVYDPQGETNGEAK